MGMEYSYAGIILDANTRIVKIGDRIMTREEYQKKVFELEKQKVALNAQIEQVNKEFGDSLLMGLEEQGITSGTKVSVKTKTWRGDYIGTETYFSGVSLVWGKMTYVFHKTKNDGTMSKINQSIGGRIISIHKI